MATTVHRLPPETPWLQKGFGRFLRRYFARNFSAVRIARDGLPNIPDGPVLVMANHPSWWDPITLLLLGQQFFPGKRCFGPIDAGALERYPVLGRLGLLPLDGESKASMRAFLRQCEQIFAGSNALGITVQGEFVDPRSRPLVLQRGIAHLMRAFPEVPVLPVALEYPFWNERRPEAVIRFGPALPGCAQRRRQKPRQLLALARTVLGDTMNQLAVHAQSREADRFITLIDGRRGVGGGYDLLRRVRSWSQGRAFDPSHETPMGDASR